MAEPPWAAWQVDASSAARSVLLVLYKWAWGTDVEAYEAGGAPPFVFPSVATVAERAGCKRTQAYEHIRSLMACGAIRADQQMRGERLVDGWLLLPRDAEVSGSPDNEVRESGQSRPGVRTTKSGSPDKTVRESGRETFRKPAI